MSEKTLYFQNPLQLNELYCERENTLSKVEQALDVKLVTREDWLRIQGDDLAIEKTESFFELLKNGRRQGLNICNSDFDNMLRAVTQGRGSEFQAVFEEPLVLKVQETQRNSKNNKSEKISSMHSTARSCHEHRSGGYWKNLPRRGRRPQSPYE